MSRHNFDEFMDFSQKGLNLFKIQVSLRIYSLDFYFKTHLEFEFLPKRKVDRFEILYHHSMFGKFWTSGRFWFLISKFVPWRVFE
jgi:hypothetical protein